MTFFQFQDVYLYEKNYTNETVFSLGSFEITTKC